MAIDPPGGVGGTRDRILGWAQLAVAILATAALIVAVISLNAETASRRAAAGDLCRVMRSIVISATPAAKRPAAYAFLQRNRLDDCRTFARDVVK